jgi:hypothetical protein
MKRFVISLYLLSVACDTPILHACDNPTPDAVIAEVEVYDTSGRVDFTQLSTVFEVTAAFAEADMEYYRGLTVVFVPTAIPWNNYGTPTTVNGFYDPELSYIEVAYLSSMPCVMDTALVHELLHRLEDKAGGKLFKPNNLIEVDIQYWIRHNTEICYAP